MNEQLQALANQALKEILDTAIQVKDFAVEQAPDVIRQLLAYNMTMSIISFSEWGLFFATVFGFAAYLWIKRPFPDSYSTSEEDAKGVNHRDLSWNNRGSSLCISAIGLLVFLVVLSETEWIWLKILVALKVYLIEYAASLVK